MKELITQLRKAIESYDSEFIDKEELHEIIDSMETEYDDLEKEKDQLQDELDETPSLTSVDLGLDTIHYYLEKGNLNVQQQINSAFNLIQPNAILY